MTSEALIERLRAIASDMSEPDVNDGHDMPQGWHPDERADDIAAAADEIERLRTALSSIASPIRAFEEQAKAEGSRLNGDMAVRLANDHHFLKDIARRALAT